jgi:hypothetical protein
LNYGPAGNRWAIFFMRFAEQGFSCAEKSCLENAGLLGERVFMRMGFKSLTAIIVISAVAACAPPPVKVAPPPIIVPPPPPPPAMPLPPGGAATSMTIPPLGVDGIRVTPNRFLSSDEYIWHFRSAINVAALNCQGPVWGQIATEYNKFIIVHKKRLGQASKTIDREYVARYPGQSGLRVRDTKMTDLYNYFALPPVKSEYCDTALRRVIEVNTVPSATLPEYSNGALTEIDAIFIRFFDAYVQYERNLADWNMKYAPRPAPQPVFAPNTQPVTPVATTGTKPG